ncbi:hypothetical protein H5410_012959 [Solanum commersonii]|uniref:Dihydroflavonol 4-reductase n=1 Tax=Solanum commersonii TaxID=4109 RepID=A0A9J6AT45_SOLCO|nr:hypothetical protein H5410_012959 [Solanum commersonii]
MTEYCVTGGTGFIAAYLINALLLKGHIVRTTVCDPGNFLVVSFADNAEKVGFLWELEGAKERLKILQANLLVEGSFDDAIQGVDGVFHTASPVLKTLTDQCVNGTLNVLNSCKKSSTLKRLVLTSSCSSIRFREDAQQISPLNESHWSDLQYFQKYNLWYAYAKTNWRVAKEYGIDLVVVNPSFVVGPLLAPQPTSTLQIILGKVKGMIGEYANSRLGFVHIEDVVGAHILVMEEQKASGRYICSNSVRHMSQINDLLKTKYPSYPHENKCGNQQGADIPHSLDTSKITQLGLPPLKSLNEMFDDCIQSFQKKGFL